MFYKFKDQFGRQLILGWSPLGCQYLIWRDITECNLLKTSEHWLLCIFHQKTKLIMTIKYESEYAKKQQNDQCCQRRLRSAWASAQSDQSSLSAWRKYGSLATHKAHRDDWSDALRWVQSHFVCFVLLWLEKRQFIFLFEINAFI